MRRDHRSRWSVAAIGRDDMSRLGKRTFKVLLVRGLAWDNIYMTLVLNKNCRAQHLCSFGILVLIVLYYTYHTCLCVHIKIDTFNINDVLCILHSVFRSLTGIFLKNSFWKLCIFFKYSPTVWEYNSEEKKLTYLNTTKLTIVFYFTLN